MAIEKDMATCADALTRIADMLESVAEVLTAGVAEALTAGERAAPKKEKSKPEPEPDPAESNVVTYEMVREQVLAYNKIHGAAKGKSLLAELSESDMKLPDIVEKNPEKLPGILEGFKTAMAEQEEG